jgi:hypothetical protein
MQLGEALGLSMQMANLPLCIPDTWCGTTTYDTRAIAEVLQASPFYKHNVPRGERAVKLAKCFKCSKSSLCCGIQIEYLRAYPDSIDDFIPAP